MNKKVKENNQGVKKKQLKQKPVSLNTDAAMQELRNRVTHKVGSTLLRSHKSLGTRSVGVGNFLKNTGRLEPNKEKMQQQHMPVLFCLGKACANILNSLSL